jgi:hypothetical protein
MSERDVKYDAGAAFESGEKAVSFVERLARYNATAIVEEMVELQDRLETSDRLSDEEQAEYREYLEQDKGVLALVDGEESLGNLKHTLAWLKRYRDGFIQNAVDSRESELPTETASGLSEKERANLRVAGDMQRCIATLEQVVG